MYSSKKCGLILLISIVLIFQNCENPINRNFDLSKKLTLLAKTWGFLKYYHPNVASGKINWDSVLIDAIPKIKKSKTSKEFNIEIANILNSAGQFLHCQNCTTLDTLEVVSFYDPTWMINEIFEDSITNKLQSIFNSRKNMIRELNFDYHYAKQGNLGTPDFSKEIYYEKLDSIDENMRILSLFRFWNVIEYFYPYKNLIDKPWDSVLVEYLPKFQNVDTNLDYFKLCTTLAQELNDAHVYVYHDRFTVELFGSYNYLYDLKKFNDRIYVSNYKAVIAQEIPLRIGDEILTIDGQKVSDRFADLEPLMSSSNRAINTKQVLNWMLTSANPSLDLTIRRDGEQHRQKINGYQYNELKELKSIDKKPSWYMLEGNIGYVNFPKIQSTQEVDSLMTIFENTNGLIIDIRGYPPYYQIWDFLSYLSPNQNHPQLTSNFKFVNAKPGFFKFSEKNNSQYAEVIKPSKNKNYKGKVILLVDENAQSRSEFCIMVFQAAIDNCLTVGSQTAGTNGETSWIILPMGVAVRFTTNGVSYPDGTQLQRKGVKIDLEVQQTLQGIIEGKDEILIAAKNIII